MDLIFIRHGKAEEQSKKIADTERQLTAEGRRKLARTLPSLGLLIRNMDKVQLWSSPLIRASQTAAVLARLFAIDNILPCDFIADGDFPALMTALKGVRPSSTLILVGHEPHLSAWSQSLCGQELPYKKGAAACIRINNLDPLDAELEWFYQPQPLGRLGENLLGNRVGRPGKG